MNARRVQCAAVMGVGVMLLLVPLVGVEAMIGQAHLAATWWSPLSGVLLVTAGLVLIIVAYRQRYPYLRAAMAYACLAQLLTVLLWIPARTGALASPDSINPLWVTGSATLIGVGLVTTVGFLAGVIYVAVLLTAMTVGYSLAHAGTWLIPGAVWRTVISAGLISVFLLVARAAMAVARQVDDERARALQSSASAAARDARAEERRRWDGVVRDEVITALRTVRAGQPERVQREQARSALEILDGDRNASRSAIPPGVALRRLRQSVIDHGDHIAVALDGDPDAGDYPVAVVQAVIGATSEAVANSLRHAGTAATQAVVGHLAADSIRVRIVDDGVGFQPDRVPGDRMGIDVGIRQRMAALPGGAADIDSSPGRGTMVSLEWQRR